MAQQVTRTYRVTEAGGPRPKIAGVNRAPGDEVQLTGDQAQHELSRGLVEPLNKADAPTADTANKAGEPVGQFARAAK